MLTLLYLNFLKNEQKLVLLTVLIDKDFACYLGIKVK
jgi:hypothetical protein